MNEIDVNNLSDALILEAYEHAKELKLDPDFIEQFKNELQRRDI